MVEQLVFAFQHFQITHLLFKHDDEDPCWGSFCFLLPQSQRPYEGMMMMLFEVPSALCCLRGPFAMMMIMMMLLLEVPSALFASKAL